MSDPPKPLVDVIGTIGSARVLPAIVLEDADAAGPLADALVAGGLRCAEVTFRTAAAEAALAALSEDPRLLVGAGTVVRPEQVDRAVAAGARFIVSPGFNTTVVWQCQQAGVPVVPGVATATEIQAAGEEGLDVLKFFPAEPLGGLAMLTALAAPFPGVRFVPTGGISPANLRDYLAHRHVLAVGGTWMVAPRLVAAGAWDEITRLTAEAVALAAES
ncbi:MAG: bifunctional 4-hydroxy-2-oxoglutarate aldolase/2-dehydro-3-deoxy-phosphogluconate aldolase [Micromonosporaceae bacterium]|nr:bifunctional 4-hydroxy-2-oxoglutarate aldolase/2-dehydro-3-deoxy-phosphogluconate aldolase [Micromonosporaceae bacterium]